MAALAAAIFSGLGISPSLQFYGVFGGAGGGGKRALATGIVAKCQSSVAGAGFSLPTGNAPTPTCDVDGQQAYLSFAAGSSQTIYDRFELPADWNKSLNLVLTAWSSGTASPTINAALVCISTGATSNPAYGSNQPVSLSIGAGSARSRSVTTLDTTGCAATDALYFRLAITANVTALNVLTVQLTE